MIETIQRVHVEATSRCNSRCPMCSRYTAMGYLQPALKPADLEPKVFYDFFSGRIFDSLKHVYFSGVYGEPCLHPELPAFVDHLKAHGTDVAIDTNGGVQGPEWWARLGKLSVKAHFSLDGLEDTNHIYRRNVKWEKVWKNFNSFLEAGGRARWTFLVFKHNEHQVEAARQIARELNVEFLVKVTQKFRGYRNWSVMEDGEKQYVIEPPLHPKYRHGNVGELEHNPQGDFFNMPSAQMIRPAVDQSNIDCLSKSRNEVFLSFSGHLFPCCFLGTLHHDSPGAVQFKNFFPIETVDLRKVTAEEALQNMKIIESTWKKESILQGKLLTCARTCGKAANNLVRYVAN